VRNKKFTELYKMAIIDSILFLFIVNMGRKCLCLTPTDCLLPGRFGLIGSDRAHIISVGSDRFVVGFRSGFGRDWTESNEIRIGSDLKFIGFRSIPTKYGSESDWKESDNNPIGSDRFFMKDVGFRWNPTRIRSFPIGSTGRIESSGWLQMISFQYGPFGILMDY
jgi:hypothetical protein